MYVFVLRILAAAVLGCTVSAAHAQVQLELRLLGPDETPQHNVSVWLLPNSGDGHYANTNQQGIARFTFPSTAYITALIDLQGVNLPRMSGRFNQSTSVYLGGARYFFNADLRDEYVRNLLSELDGLYQDRPVPPALRQQLEQQNVRGRILQATRGAETNAGLQGERQRLLEQLDRLLTPPRRWYLGVRATNTSSGARIDQVVRNTPAAQAGIRSGEYIVAVDGRRVGIVNGQVVDLIQQIRQSQTGTVDLQVLHRTRDTSSIRAIQIELEER